MAALLDCHCAIGPVGAPPFGCEFPSATELLESMHTSGIREALVYSTVAVEYDAPTGNQALLEAIAGVKELHPCWVLLPGATREMEEPSRVLESMERAGVKACRLCPGIDRHNFSLSEWSVGPLFAELERCRVPLFLDSAEVAWDALHDLLTHHPRLPVVLTGVNYRMDRFLYPLWRQHRNLMVEISGYVGFGAIEAVVDQFGSDRLVFGTGSPLYEPGAAVAALSFAEIAPAEKERIGGDTMRDLLEAAFES